MSQMEIRRPSDLIKHFAYILAYAPDGYPQEDGSYTNTNAFNDAFRALKLFREHIETEEGAERLQECQRHLKFAYEFFEQGLESAALRCVRETMEMTQKCARHIAIADQ